MLTKEKLEASFSGDIEKVNLTFLYKIALFLISFTMILLPLIYFGIVFFAGWGVIFFAKDPFNAIESGTGFLALFVQYAGPVIISVVILIFMIKPFFVRLIKPAEGIIITKDKEPLLFEFIEIICKKVNAPIPKHVLLNADANAAAGFKPGMLGFFTGDLRLIIGLPLVATMSVSQLGGILAHEFGHFSQGAGMRLSFVVRVISNWFSRVVFERDKWDEKLESWSTNTHIALALILGLARIGVWLSRKVLFVLMTIGNLVSTVMLRQMEFDADRYEIRFGGSRQFVKTTKKLKLVSINWAIMYQGVFESWSNKKLNNNIPMYLAHKVSSPNEKLASHIEKEIEETKTGFFDTHPSDKERIENAQKENSPGIFNLDVPALQLFRNFDTHSLKTSVLFYKNLMSDDYKDEYLVDIDEFLENDKTIEQNDKALLELFKGAISVHFPINFGKQPEPEPRPDPEKEIEEITDFLEKNSDSINQIIDSKYNLVDDRLLWKSAELIVSKGSKVNPKEFKLESGKMKEIDVVLQVASEKEMELNFEYEVFRRKIARIPEVLKEIIDDQEQILLINKLMECEIKFAQYYSSIQKIMDLHSQFLIIAINASSLDGNKKIHTTFEDLIFKLERDLKDTNEYFKKVPNPFKTTDNFGDLLFPEDISTLNRDTLINVCQTFYQLYIINYCRIVGQIGVIAMNYLEKDKLES